MHVSNLFYLMLGKYDWAQSSDLEEAELNW